MNGSLVSGYFTLIVVLAAICAACGDTPIPPEGTEVVSFCTTEETSEGVMGIAFEKYPDFPCYLVTQCNGLRYRRCPDAQQELIPEHLLLESFVWCEPIDEDRFMLHGLEYGVRADRPPEVVEALDVSRYLSVLRDDGYCSTIPNIAEWRLVEHTFASSPGSDQRLYERRGD